MKQVTDQIERALAAAGLDPHGGRMEDVLGTIHQAFEAAGLRPRPAAAGEVIDAPSRWADEPQADASARDRPAPASGRFIGFVHSSAAGSRAYKLYVPSNYSEGRPMPLVVMLHGCKQDPDDFARGTRMNEVAEEQGLLVAYPAQSRRANGSNCWQWFEPGQQLRSGAEPSIIVGIVREIARSFSVDARRTYVAGLSAGAAMAVILGDTWPDVFAAVAVHSGLPRGAAHDVASAFAAMHGTAPGGASHRPSPAPAHAVPTIVFHGGADTTVVAANGASIAAQAVCRFEAEGAVLRRDEAQFVRKGRSCLLASYLGDDGVPRVEHWNIAGAGHAWLGGHPSGSFADPAGPDASREMARFFALHASPSTRGDTALR